MTTDQLSTLTASAAKKAAKGMTLTELVNADLDFAHRAIQLGRTGTVTRTHAAIRNELAAR
jgi:hypothetical protein